MPANASRASTPDFSSGSLRSNMLIFNWQPGASWTSLPCNRPSTDGATLDSTNRASKVSEPQTTAAVLPSDSTDVTSAPVTICAPASRATRSSSAVTAPLPPTGTFHSPVPLPMMW